VASPVDLMRRCYVRVTKFERWHWLSESRAVFHSLHVGYSPIVLEAFHRLRRGLAGPLQSADAALHGFKSPEINDKEPAREALREGL
jgi:hypothetical protein